MENKGYELYDNYDVNYTEWFEEFKEYCLGNDIDPTQYDEDSEYFHNWVYDTLNMYWDDFICDIKYDKDNNVDCVVVADLGLWYGRRDAVKHFSTLKDAIYACVKNCDYINITLVDGVIKVRASHHDGTNYFEIHKLNAKGYDAYCEDEELNNEEYFDMFNFNW
jgi:hypothetical protein